MLPRSALFPLPLPLLLLIGSSSQAQQYCLPLASAPMNGTDHTVAHVQLQAIHYGMPTSWGNSWWDLGYRGDSSITRLFAGQSYTLTVTSGTSPNAQHAAWLDFHDAPAGLQANELLELGSNTAANEALSITFDVPADAVPGYRLLRVRAGADLSALDPCAQVGEGETEDYQVLIEGDRCIPLLFNGTSGGDSISAITLDAATLSIPTGRSAYKDLGDLTNLLHAGTQHTLHITTGAYHNDRVGAWADWNGDGSFDASETLGAGANTTAFETITLPFDVPTSVPTGSVVPIRIRLYYASWNADACADLYHGQTVDGTMIVQNSTGLPTHGLADQPSLTGDGKDFDLLAPSAWIGSTITWYDAIGRTALRARVQGERGRLAAPAQGGAYTLQLSGAAGYWSRRVVVLP